MFFERNLQEAVEGYKPVNLEVEPKEVGLWVWSLGEWCCKG